MNREVTYDSPGIVRIKSTPARPFFRTPSFTRKRLSDRVRAPLLPQVRAAVRGILLSSAR